jgi:hypothetical protein
MAAPPKIQIQMLIVNKIFANAVSSTKTLGSDLRAIYSNILDHIYGTAVPLEAVTGAIDTDIKTNSIGGVRITGERLKRYLDNLVYLAYLPFADLPPRIEAENRLYPHLSYYSTRTDVTIGNTLREITRLMLDKIYDGVTPPDGTEGIFDYTFSYVFE